MLITDVGQAEHLLCEALSISRRQDAKSLELRAATQLARGLTARRCSDEVRSQLSGIYSWFSEGLDTRDLQEAKALLEELT